MSVRVIIKPHIATEVEGVILEKVEVKILRKSISYLKENPADRMFKVLASCT
jgi:hypothetical protein